MRYIKLFLALFFLIGFVTACKNNPQIDLGAIPIYLVPTATPEPVAEGTPTPEPPPTPEPLKEIAQGKLDQSIQDWLKELKSAAEKEGMGLAVKIFTLPDGTKWDEVESYYKNKLGGDWEKNDSFHFDVKKKDAESQTLTTTGWENKASNKDQALVIGIIVDKGNKKFLVVALFTEK